MLALSPGARSAFLEIFRIRGATVERVETLPDVRAQRLDFGERVSREAAERRAGFDLLDLGTEPDAIFIRPDGLVSVVYGDPARPRLVLSQARGAIYDGFIKKTGGRGTIIREVTVDGERGLYVSGPDHFVMFRDENGFISDERTYLAGTVLLWNRGDLLLRLEGDLTPGRGGRARRVRRVGNLDRARCIPSVNPNGGPDEEAPARARRRRRRCCDTAGAASAGGWATVGLSSLPPSGLKADQPWPVDITVLQHGQTPLAGVTPVVRIRDDGGAVVDTFTATPTGRTGVYHAVVRFPARARTRTRSTTASGPTAARERTRSSPSRSAPPAARSRTPSSGSPSPSRSALQPAATLYRRRGQEPAPVTNLREAA